MIFNRYILFILTLIISVSCNEREKEIDFDTYFEGSKIVIHGFISKNDGVNVIVKKTVSPANVGEDDLVENAEVMLVENKTSITLLHSVDGCHYNYSSGLLSEGVNYQIQVASPNMDNVISKKQVLIQPALIDSIYVEYFAPNSKSNIHVYYEHLKLTSNYYLQIYEYKEGIAMDSLDYRGHFFNPALIIKPNFLGKQSYEYRTHLSGVDSVKVKLYTLSEDIILFSESLDSYESTEENPFYDHVFPVYSNIENGCGLFASYAYDSKTAIIE